METRELVVALASIIAGYLIGGIPWGVVIARMVGGRDPRAVGSGRTGGANVLRALGPRVALVAGVLDLLKGSVAVVIPALLGAGVEVQGIAAMASIVGHSRSPYIGFRGGRGVSPAFGALLVLWPLVALLSLAAFVAIVKQTRYSSLGSLVSSALSGGLVIAIVFLQHLPAGNLLYAVGGPLLIWLFHLDNIGRLLSGKERTIDASS